MYYFPLAFPSLGFLIGVFGVYCPFNQRIQDVSSFQMSKSFQNSHERFIFYHFNIKKKLWAEYYNSHCAVILNIMQKYLNQLRDAKYDKVCRKFLYKAFFTNQATVSVVPFTAKKNQTCSSFTFVFFLNSDITFVLWKLCTDSLQLYNKTTFFKSTSNQ